MSIINGIIASVSSARFKPVLGVLAWICLLDGFIFPKSDLNLFLTAAE